VYLQVAAYLREEPIDGVLTRVGFEVAPVDEDGVDDAAQPANTPPKLTPIARVCASIMYHPFTNVLSVLKTLSCF